MRGLTRFTRLTRLASVSAGVAGALVVVLAGAATTLAGGGCHVPEGTEATEGTGRLIRIDTCVFGPTILHVARGSAVTWENRDQVPHAVTGIDWGSSASFNPGASVSHRFTAPGVYPYQCYLHPGMSGVVVVGTAGLAAPGSGAPTPATVETSSEVAPGTVEQPTGSPPTPSPTEEHTVPARTFAFTAVALGLTGLLGGLVAGFLLARRDIGRRRSLVPEPARQPVA